MGTALPMRRKNQALSEEDCRVVLGRATAGVLALNDPGQGVPYQVPLSYALIDAPEEGGIRLVFHGALKGHKMDLLAADGRASFTVVDQDEIVPEKFTSLYRSVVCAGRVRVISDAAEREGLLVKLSLRFWPGHRPEAEVEARKFLDATAVLVFDVASMTGKQARGLARART